MDNKDKQKFSLAKNGYSKEEVDAFVSTLTEEFEKISGEQKKRIFELKSSLLASENKLKTYSQMSGRISEAISEAVLKAEQIEKYSMQKLHFEIEQLKAFHERWQEYYQRIMHRYPLDEDLEGVSRFNSTMTKILSGDKFHAEEVKAAFESHEAIKKNHRSETKRLKSTASAQSAGAKPTSKNTAKSLGGEKDDRLGELLDRIVNADDIDEDIVSAIDGELGFFDPLSKIQNYYECSGEGFSLLEALKPTKDLKDILKDIGVYGDE